MNYGHESTPINFGSKQNIFYYLSNLEELTCLHRSDKFLYFARFTSCEVIDCGFGKKPSTCIAKEIEIKYGF